MPMKIFSFFFSLVLILCMGCITPPAYAQTADGDLDSITKQLADLNDQLNKSVAATKPLESELTSIQKQINGIKSRVLGIEQDSRIKSKEIDRGYKDFAEKEKVISQTIRSFYIKSSYDSPFLIFLSLDNATQVTQSLAYQRAKTKEDKALITNIALSINDLENKKKQLEQEQKWLIATRADLDKQSAKLDGVVKGAKDYQSNLSGKIADLSAKQQEIVNARSGDFTFSIGDGGLSDEYLASAKGFREAAPSGSFAIFSFGAYTHRNGMSQYGAKGRAESGQNYKDILSKYYPGKTIQEGYSEPSTVSVDGFGSVDFQQYLYGIAEMPSSWNTEALKAQAVAARSYALAYTNNGQKSICTTQSCQVYIGHSKGGAWQQAVDETKGIVLTDGGNPVSTQYASTDGGYTNTSGWDTTDGAGGSNFIDKAYEKTGGSPWLYKSWWRQGTSNSGDTCGRSNPWLSGQEMADIVNAALAIKASGVDTSRITPVTTSCWGGNPYSMDELKSKAPGGINQATSVSVSQGNGNTNSVTINGITLSGQEFRNAVALRAPGYIRIPQGSYPSGWAFFNVEMK